MKSIRFGIFLTLGLWVVFHSGCQTSYKTFKKPPSLFEQHLSSQIRNMLERNNQAINSVKSLVQLKARTPFWTKNSDALLLIKGDQWLKMQTIDDFGQPRHQYLIASYEFQYFNPLYREWHVTKASQEVIEDHLHLHLTPQELILLLTGRLPLEKDPYRVRVTSRRDKGKIIDLVGKSSTISLDSLTMLPQKIQLMDEEGEERIEVKYFYPPQLPENRFPSMIQASLDKAGTQLTLTFIDTVINAKLDKKLFRLDIPKGVSPQPLH
ncbi:MAG: hypothetical protein A3F89_01635 [Deltaproteobacteria bacterium RIFCSPLOWO2_12_FULL_50_11]|nr:MAG: hypothetical protein A2053_02415 [Deltaproteobacteria bacterium GWA2_50_8]OGQ32402.1 MAG: hypothetical protein A3B79_02255 [Deltaproteobacteria bacterium RIFCSPHIGHO2_02_FULL_50_15]OGQ66067.1 MAG: hypothetical protein A3F89_01635 [Deltaproteobacteria bacterium RIFCSPLOWO2_12_FULL_50_11]